MVPGSPLKVRFLPGDFFKFFEWSVAVQLLQPTMASAALLDQRGSCGMATQMNSGWKNEKKPFRWRSRLDQFVSYSLHAARSPSFESIILLDHAWSRRRQFQGRLNNNSFGRVSQSMGARVFSTSLSTIPKGTSWDCVANIAQNGFNRAYGGRHGSKLGRGAFQRVVYMFAHVHTASLNVVSVWLFCLLEDVRFKLK